MKFKLCALLLFFTSYAAFAVDKRDDRGKTKNAFLESRSFTYTLNLLLEDLTKDLKAKVSKPISSVLTKFTLSSNLPEEFDNYAAFKVVEAVSKNDKMKLINCIECLTVHMDFHNGEYILKKGITDRKEMEKTLSSFKADAYTEVNLSLIGVNLNMLIVVYDKTSNNIIYSGEFTKPIYSVRDDGLIFGLTLGSMTVKSNAMLGGGIYVGQRISGFGDVGINMASFSSKELKGISSVSFKLDLNFNELFENYWKVGSILFTNSLGFASYKSNAQLFYAPGLKLKFGYIFHVLFSYNIFKVLKLTTTTPVEGQAPPPVNPDANFPSSLLVGIGVDLG